MEFLKEVICSLNSLLYIKPCTAKTNWYVDLINHRVVTLCCRVAREMVVMRGVFLVLETKKATWEAVAKFILQPQHTDKL